MAQRGGFKRKDLDDSDFVDHDFSFTSPALKIRRLDADSLPTIMEEGLSLGANDHPAVVAENGTAAPVVIMDESATESAPQSPPSYETENLERALVLFKPVNILPSSYSQSSNFSVALDSKFLSGFNRDQMLSPGQPFELKSAGNCAAAAAAARDGCKAVVPWVSPQQASRHCFQTESQEPVEADEAGVVSMDVEESESDGNFEQGRNFYNLSVPQWPHQQQLQQQHCLIPELPRSNLTPVTWFTYQTP